MRYLVTTITIFSCLVARADDFETRLAHHSFAKADLDDEGFSVLIEQSSLHEVNRPSHPDDTEEEIKRSADEGVPKGTIRERFAECQLSRLVVGKGGKWQRVDGTEYSLLGPDSNLNHTTYYAEMIHELEGWFYKDFRLRKAKPASITRFRIAGGIGPGLSHVKRRHPFDVSFAQVAGLTTEGIVPTLKYDHKIVEESMTPEGRSQIWTFIPEGDAFKFVFNKEESWSSEIVEFWTNEEMYKSFPSPKISELSMETLKSKYKRYAVNRTMWKRIGKHTVPVETIISSQTRFENVEYEVRYMDWRFKDDADLTLLEKENFTIEAIPKSMNFPKLREQFDQHHSGNK